MTLPDGILPVDKPIGPTSHDVVAIARRALRMRRIGHTGTLDPFASGLLLLCLGTATRLSEYLTALPKTYRATFRLGAATATDDHMGEVVASSDEWRGIDELQVRLALARQEGAILQRPPLYSAKKIGGERMYDLARRAEGSEGDPRSVPVPDPVPVTVYRAELTGFAPPDVSVEIDCSSGTYIRSIARDLGETLGIGAHVTVLRRTRIGSFDIDDALSLEHLNDGDAVRRAIRPPSAAVSHLPSMRLGDDDVDRIRRGMRVTSADPLPEDTPVALLDADGGLVAIGEAAGEVVHPRKVFA